MILSMAVSRSKWVDQVAGKLSGAFREYCKQILSDRIGYKGHDWNKEIERLVIPIRFYLSGEKKTKTKFSRSAAFAEAIEDMLGDGRLMKARHLLEEHPLTQEQRMKLERLSLDETSLFKTFLKKYLAEDVARLGYKI